MIAFKCLRLIIAFTLVAKLVASAPIVTDFFDDAELVIRGPGANDKAKAVSIAHQIRRKLRPEPNKAVFWSGTKVDENGKTVSVLKDAKNFAKKTGKETINMSLKKKGIAIPSQQTNSLARRLWHMASKTMAKRASGDTHAVLGENIRKDSVWKTIEEKELMKNDKVTKVTEHNQKTGTSKVTKRK